ncbi:MAG: 3-isopropylmalate dehydrogenase [Candidatus Omnitrophica bacterium]|nr:3-isopropylmalate dehydrogenase [Candidatus Omnitrophota bacterium]MCB9784646.1 3-isopropylmalate dehydrogenase [Candidatus Omnitrophota bacterium]
MSLKLAVLPGDGTGPEVVREALKVLAAIAKDEGIEYTTQDFDYGGDRYLSTGEIINDEQIEELRAFDAILLGAVGHPDVKPGILEKGLLLRLRFALDQYINLRPVKLYPGVDTPLKDKGPEDINFDVIRENTEDLYCGNGGILRKGTPQEVATQEMIATRFGAERALRFAFEFCKRKKEAGEGKGLLTLVSKTNVLTYCGDLWFRAFEEIGEADYPDIKRDYNHVDACCMWFVKNPEFYDTIIVPNMFGDIITDLGAMIQGGMGIAAGGNINPDEGGTSMYEPIGGSAPKYTGQDVINPLAAIGALAMLLQNSGYKKAGDRVEEAIKKTTPKLKSLSAGKMGYSTTEVGNLVVDNL